MAVTVYANKGYGVRPGGQEMVAPGEKLWLTRDGKRLVKDGDPESYSLYCTADYLVPRAEYEALKVGEAQVAQAQEAEPPAPANPDDEDGA